MAFFYAYCSKISSERGNEIKLRKFTYDLKSKSYFVVPESSQSLDEHPLIKHSKQSNFSKLNQARSGYRHVALPLKDHQGRASKEALKYIDLDGDFCLNGVKLVAESGEFYFVLKLP